jgi:ribosomal-protein-alanine N-acetyltransferase
MTPEAMARLHSAAFAPERGWSAREFEALCASSHVRTYTGAHGFALLRVVADEAELLALAVAPDQRRRGIGDALMRRWIRDCGARRAFLEVAEDNIAARALYARHGFTVAGRRKAYYSRPGAPSVDALLMQATLGAPGSPESGLER